MELLIAQNISNISDITHTIDSKLIKSVEITQNCIDGQYDCLLRYSTGWTVALCVAYLFVFFIGLVGNMSVLWIIYSFRRTYELSVFNSCNKVFNGLIGNLAFADLLVVIFCLPPTLVGNIFRRKFTLLIDIFIYSACLNNKLRFKREISRLICFPLFI